MTMPAPFPSPTSTWHIHTYPSISPSRPELSAKGKVVFITGGGSGIGAETARHFAEAGASRIAILSRREQALLDTKTRINNEFPNVEIFTAAADITKKNEVDAAFSEFIGHSDAKIDVLVSCAAMSATIESVEAAEAELFLSDVTDNLKGVLLVAKAFLRHAAPKAVVIDVSSAAAYLSLGPKFDTYSISKLAIFRLWQNVAFVKPEMTIFHLQPGVVDTEFSRKNGGVKAMGFEDHVSLPASFNVWLASPEARFLKGRFLFSNWDVDELKAQAQQIEAGAKFTIGMVGWPFVDAGIKA